MEITIQKLKADEATPFVTVDRLLLLTADKSRIVEAGDPDGAFVFASPGKRCSRDELLRLGVRITRAGTEKKQASSQAEKVETTLPKSKVPASVREKKQATKQAEKVETTLPKSKVPAAKKSKNAAKK